MRYILALMMAVPLLFAGSAWAGPCERPILPNTVELSEIPEIVRKDIGRHIDSPLAQHHRPTLLK